MEPDSIPSIKPAVAHHEWSQRVDTLSAPQRAAYSEAITASANNLGIWKNGGHVPMQPFVVSRDASHYLHTLGRRIQSLICRRALDRAGHDLNRLADIAALDEPSRWFLKAARPLPEALACRRSDVYIEAGRPRFLEVNFGTCLNGTTATSVLTNTFTVAESVQAVRPAHDLSAHSFFAARTAWAAKANTSGLSTALLGFAAQGDEGSLKVFELEAAYMVAHGVPCDFVPMEEVEIHDHAVHWRGKRYGAAIRYFMVTDRTPHHMRDLIDAVEMARNTVLLGSYVSQLFTSKALLADLHADLDLASSDRDVLSCVPWTARLAEGFSTREGQRVEPMAWAVRSRSRAVLKPFNGFGSRGVVLGHQLTEAQWQQALNDAIGAGNYVVQERVKPDPWPMRYWSEETASVVSVNSPVMLGPYVVDGVDGGCFAQQPLSGAAEDLVTGRNGVSHNCVLAAPH